MNSVKLSQGLTIAPYSMQVLTLLAKDENIHSFRKGTSFRLQKNVLGTGIYTYHVYCSHDESKYRPMLNNPNLNNKANKKAVLGSTLLDCTQKIA